ncbi:MAG: hypothetical protein WAP52_03160 [Candidatus Sungiibacteriota bacterium]
MPNAMIGNSENTLTSEQIAERGQKLYEEKLKAVLEPTQKGKFAAIEVESGDYFIADTLLEALQKGKEKYPDRLLHTVRVGYEGVFKMGGYASKGFSYGWQSSR